MRKHTKKGKSTKTKISNSNKSNINITIHNSEKKHKRATRKKKGEAYQAPKQNPKGFTNTVTTGAPPAKNYQDDPKEKAAVENYNNRKPLEIANEANNPLIEQIHMLEQGNNALHQEFDNFKTGINAQGNALLHEMNNLKYKSPLKILDKKRAGRPKKEATAEPAVIKKAVGRPKKVATAEPEIHIEEYKHDPHLTTPEGAAENNQLNSMVTPSFKKPKERPPQKVVVNQKDSPSKKQQEIDDVLYRGANYLNTDRSSILSPELKEEAFNDLFNELMEDLHTEPTRIRKARIPYTP